MRSREKLLLQLMLCDNCCTTRLREEEESRSWETEWRELSVCVCDSLCVTVKYTHRV